MNSEQLYMQRLRALVDEAERARFLIGPEAAARTYDRPLLLNDRLLARDRYEKAVLAARLPRTLIGRAPNQKRRPE